MEANNDMVCAGKRKRKQMVM